MVPVVHAVYFFVLFFDVLETNEIQRIAVFKADRLLIRDFQRGINRKEAFHFSGHDLSLFALRFQLVQRDRVVERIAARCRSDKRCHTADGMKSVGDIRYQRADVGAF